MTFITNNCTTFAINVWNNFAESEKQIKKDLVSTPKGLKEELRKRGSKIYTQLPTYGADGTDTYKITWTGEYIQLLTGDTQAYCTYDSKTNSISVSWDQIKKRINRKDYNLDGYVVFCIDSEERETYVITDDVCLLCNFSNIKPDTEYRIAIASKKDYTNPAIYDYSDKPFRRFVYYTLTRHQQEYNKDLNDLAEGFQFKNEEIKLTHMCLISDTTISTSTKRDIKDASVTGLSAKTYTGKALTPAPTVTLGSTVLTPNTDYTVSYNNNINAGTATLTITGTGNYAGTKTATFTINKAPQTITAKSSASTITVGKTAIVSITGAKGKKSYRSSNTSIAIVNNSTGVLTGKKGGEVTITATSAATANYKAASKTIKIHVVLAKPNNCHFVKWNNSMYTSCRVGWNNVNGAEGYEIRMSWTDGSHLCEIDLMSNVLYHDLEVHPQHVSQMKVRAFYNKDGKRVFGPWSNIEYITPSPSKLTTKNASSGSNRKMNISWNIIYGCNGYNVFITTNPNGTWYWNQSTSTKATATSAVITKYRGSSLKKNTRYYVRIVTRRKRNGVFCTVPMPAKNTYVGSFIIK